MNNYRGPPLLKALHIWRLPLVLAVIIIVVQLFHLRGALQYQRALVSQGELWRLCTGNFVHLNWIHLLLDLLGLVLIWLTFSEYLSERRWFELCVTSGWVIGVGLYALSPRVHWYAGLSAMEFSLYGAGALLEWRHCRWRSLVMLAGAWVLVSYGVLMGSLPTDKLVLGIASVPQAHLYGLAYGMLFVLIR